MSSTSGNVDNNSQMSGTGSGYLSVSRVVSLTTSQTWYFVASSTPSLTLQNPSFNATRIG